MDHYLAIIQTILDRCENDNTSPDIHDMEIIKIGFWGHLKRTLKGVHHWVSRKHLQRYVDSSAFRYNTKHLSECERFDVLLQNIGHRLRYSQLKNMAA